MCFLPSTVLRIHTSFHGVCILVPSHGFLSSLMDTGHDWLFLRSIYPMQHNPRATEPIWHWWLWQWMKQSSRCSTKLLTNQEGSFSVLQGCEKLPQRAIAP